MFILKKENVMYVGKNRPNFGPGQIRSSKEISLGDKVIPMYLDVEGEPIEIIGYFVNSVG